MCSGAWMRCARSRAREGMTGAAVEAMLLPLVALADEIALGQRDTLASVWADRPLQMHYFRENVAGELFFSQMEAARREPSTSPLVLRAYFLGLCLGFRGRYALHDDPTELDRTRELLRDDLERRGLLRARVSGSRRARSDRRRRRWAASVGAVRRGRRSGPRRWCWGSPCWCRCSGTSGTWSA
jgi:type IV/VI secretion system ImpK/VasF family protein